MSWSFSVPQTAVGDFDASADAAAEEYKKVIAGTDWQPTAEATAAIEQAIAAAKAIVASGVAGTGTVIASLSGHANPLHAPTSGYANDCVTVSVTCADTYQPPVETEAAASVPEPEPTATV